VTASTVVLTVAIVVLIVYAIRALHQLTLTIRKLDQTLERSSQTMDRMDTVLADLHGRLADLEPLATTVNSAREFLTDVGGGMLRRARGPAVSVAGIALGALKGFETFLTYRGKAKEGNQDE
jgi:uncharacterized protein YoxC